MNDKATPERALGLTVLQGGRAKPPNAVARLRDFACDGPATQDMLEFAQYLADQADDALAAAERGAERLRKLGEQMGDPADLEIAAATAVLNRRMAALMKRQSDAMRELLAYLEAIPPRDAMHYSQVVFSIIERSEALDRARQQRAAALSSAGGAAQRPEPTFADAVSLALDRIEVLVTDLSELEGTLASCRGRFGHLPAPPRQPRA